MSKSSDLDLGQGEKTVTASGTAERLLTGARGEVAVISVTIKALSTNTGKVYVGGHDVSTANGFDLDPRDSIELATDRTTRAINLADIYLDVDTGGEGVRFIYLRE